MVFSLKSAMSAACAAQRINKKYIRKNDGTEEFPANSRIMYNLLTEKTDMITAEDTDQAETILVYLQAKVAELIAETLGDYWKTAVLLYNQDITNEDYRTLAFIASIPNSYMNAVARDQVENNMLLLGEKSVYLGDIGASIPKTSMQVLGSVYSRNYLKWYHTAITADNNLVRFPLNEQLTDQHTYRISGKIHKLGENNTTILHYVRVQKTVDNH